MYRFWDPNAGQEKGIEEEEDADLGRFLQFANIRRSHEVTHRFCWFSIANTGWPNSTSCPNLKLVGPKLRPWERRSRKEKKWPPWRHQIEISKTWEKKILAHVLGTNCVKFHQNRPSCLGCRVGTHTQTDRQTNRQTDKQTDKHPRSILTYSV